MSPKYLFATKIIALIHENYYAFQDKYFNDAQFAGVESMEIARELYPVMMNSLMISVDNFEDLFSNFEPDFKIFRKIP